MNDTDRRKLFAEIARKHLGIQTLETRRMDMLDFHDVAVWGVVDALAAAFEAGRAESDRLEGVLRLRNSRGHAAACRAARADRRRVRDPACDCGWDIAEKLLTR